MITIKTEDGYLYVGRGTYDACVALDDRYSLESMITKIGREGDLELVKDFYDMLPKPVNILAPFLMLYTGPMLDSFDDNIGILHVIATQIDVRNYVNIDPEIRKSLTYSVTAQEEYELQWEQFFKTSIPYEERHSIGGGASDDIGGGFDFMDTTDDDNGFSFDLDGDDDEEETTTAEDEVTEEKSKLGALLTKEED